VAFESKITVNGHTFPIIPDQFTLLIKECWIAVGKSLVNNPIEKITLTASNNLVSSLQLVLSFAIQCRPGAMAHRQHLWKWLNSR